MEQQPVLQVNNITKYFPGVVALDHVNFHVRAGEVHALVGENGAGKSTLMKVLGGIYKSDKGHIVHNGEKIHIHSPRDAIERGILLVHQELSLSPELSVAENIFLGAWPTNRLGILQKKKMNQKAEAALKTVGCNFKPQTLIKSLSIAKKQMVEIARVSAYNANVVIFDEPTATLTDTETEQLFAIIRQLREAGVAIVYISHKMDEIFSITDRITILRDGRVQGTLETKDTRVDEITKMMIGRSLDSFFMRAKEQDGQEVLRIEGLTKTGLFKDIDFSVKSGEVLGLYGLIGAGRSELAEAIFGLHKPDSGHIYYKGEKVKFSSPKDAIKKGFALVPEDRKEQGLVLDMGGLKNITLPHLKMFSNKMAVMDEKKELSVYHKYKEQLQIKTTGPALAPSKLSGGNQQKFVLAKWLCTSPNIIILDEPTRGIDVGSKAAIHELIAQLAEQGLAVIVISSEMPEIIGVCHRILAMGQGRIVGEFAGDEMTEENLIHAVSLHG